MVFTKGAKSAKRAKTASQTRSIVPAGSTEEVMPAVSPLLGLPRELRDMIWEYALTNENGIFYHYKANDTEYQLFTSPDPSDPYDSEIYKVPKIEKVCRLLREDADGLALKLNHITFTRIQSDEPEPEVQFLKFVNHCTERAINQLRTVTLIPLEEECEEMVTPHIPLVNFCLKHPKVRVNQQFNQLSNARDPYYAFVQGILLKQHTGRFDVNPQVKDCMERLINRNYYRHTIHDYSSSGGFPSNLRFRAYGEAKLNERNWIPGRLTILYGKMEPRDDHNWELVMAEVRRWYQQGI